MAEVISGLTACQRVAIAVSLVIAAFLIVDPLVLGAVRSIDPDTYRFFRSLTNLGRSNWILIPAGIGILLLVWMRARETGFRRAAIYGYATQLLLFLFATIALSGLSASLIKNVLGRARPKLFDQAGPFEFRPFTFDADFASFPSGHATTAGALAGVLAIIWPQARVPLFLAAAWIGSTRFLIGAHYLTDVVAGCVYGAAFAYFLRGRLADRRWLFSRGPDGTVALRGRVFLDAATAALKRRIYDWAPPLLTGVKPPESPRQ